ncbi:MAG: hypothetical protein QUS07_01265 [Methanothrix sp.]|nr:hypothetical protein [Methanothrix sp.]
MTKSIFVLVSFAFILAVAGLAATAYAECSACQGEQNWSASAISFLEGKAVDETQPLWGPKAERMRNSQLNSNADKAQTTTSVASDSSKGAANAEAARIDLINVSIEPNPVSSGSYAKIIAVFNESTLDSSADQPGKETLMTAVATITDSANRVVGKLSLLRSTDNEYSGVWNANVAAGIYNATIVASSMQASGTFKDALRIEVTGTGDAADNTTVNATA